MRPRDLIPDIVDRANDYVAEEVEYWRRELRQPWETGHPSRAAQIGRWIGVGLALSATAAGVIAALHAEKPWR